MLEMAASFGIATLVIDRTSFYESEDLMAHVAAMDLLVLAGFCGWCPLG
ncbi:MAG: hypothetical protein R2795_09185 [Saprospiraceae bacterium]